MHLVGIGGMGMAGLAQVLLDRGHRVTGEDLFDSPRTRALAALGIPLETGRAGRLPARSAAVVASAAVPAGHPAIDEAVARGLPVLKYARAVAEVVRGRHLLAVAGTHGKTTTTAWIAHMLRLAGLEPGWIIGGEPVDLGRSGALGAGPDFALEACEYDRSFLSYEPSIAVVTNVDADHLDVYGTLDALREAFACFLGRVVAGGAAIVCADDPAAAGLRVPALVRRVSYGLLEGAQVRGEAVPGERPGETAIRIPSLGVLPVRLPGLHNARNALAVLATARALGLPDAAAAAAIETFRGVRRRFEFLGDASGVTWINDYGHHPTEIRATAESARARFPGRRLLAFFQPHQRHRTIALFDAFAEALGAFDSVAVGEIYGARESAAGDGSLETDLARASTRRGCPRAVHRPGLEGIAWLRDEARPGDVAILLGAGDVGDRIEEVGRVAGFIGEAAGEARAVGAGAA